jgi:D-amino-acid dehydrogenase
MRVIEPALQGDFYGGYYTDSDSTGDIHKFTSGLADACARLGVACRYGQEVTALAREHGKVRVSMGADSTLFDAVVVRGHGQPRHGGKLGDHVNVYPVKGYSITVQLDDAASRAAAPSVSLLDDATKLVSSRLGEDRLRVAGTAEFNGINYDIRADRIRPLVRWVEQCFPASRPAR